MLWHKEADEDETSWRNSSSADPSDYPSNDQCVRGRGSCADERAELEDPDIDDEHPFDRVERVDSAEGELQDAQGKQETCFEPRDVAKTIEAFRDGWNCNSNDGPILV